MSTPLKPQIAVPRSNDRIVNGVKYNRSGSGRSKFEMLAWLYMRLSGVILLVLVFGHLIANLMVPEGGVHAIDFGFVGGKWANPFWQVWDLAMLWLAMLHGANGMRTIIDDYAERDGARFWLKLALFLATGFIILLGTLVIFTFEPCPAGADPELLASFCPGA
ncbi:MULTISPECIES: succinate dehydrogenase hydrophobic membrane anchor subunit [Kocuria]|uniref:Succinate dehydrogenase hydrophobic membrane anchor subunit n=1 Tax=Kocuria subflava TaxID=1736139 RepID=A0A846TQ74_9MICC|nr:MULTISPECIES: succinate dehydrogenase hydrophobic membrane anchor subunit [Kocuria]NKE09070.1 succinate dehydrogenase hydrophobic membrane anchor subunit [Kocuria subflava]